MQLSVQLAPELFPGEIGERGDDKGINALCTSTSTRPHRCGFRRPWRRVTGYRDIGFDRQSLAAGRGNVRDHLLGFLGAGR